MIKKGYRKKKSSSKKKVSFKSHKKPSKSGSLRKSSFRRKYQTTKASPYRKVYNYAGSFSKRAGKIAQGALQGATYASRFGYPMYGALAGGVLGAVAGSGDYRTSTSLMTQQGTQIPEFKHKNHSYRLTHREYVGDISSSESVFALSSYNINAGNPSLFPWLSSIAANYEQYRFHGLIIELRSIAATSTGQTNGNMAQGFMALGCEYNAALPSVINKYQLDNLEFAVSGPVSTNVMLPIECKKRQNVLTDLYVNVGTQNPSSEDPRLYNLGILQLAVGNSPAAFTCAELWVSYDVEFFKPQLTSTPGYDIATAHYTTNNSGVSTSLYFDAMQPVAYSNISLILGTTTITFPSNITSGNFALMYQVVGGSTASVIGPSIAATTNCVALPLFNDDGQSLIRPVAATTTNAYSAFIFTVTGPAAVLTFSSGTMPSSITWADLFITQFNGLVNT